MERLNVELCVEFTNGDIYGELYTNDVRLADELVAEVAFRGGEVRVAAAEIDSGGSTHLMQALLDYQERLEAEAALDAPSYCRGDDDYDEARANEFLLP